MEQLELKAKSRKILGKDVRFLRRQGLTPANIFGREGSHPIEVETPLLYRVLAQAGRTGLIALKVENDRRPRMVMVRGLQRDPRSGGLLHVDFYQVRLTEKIEAEVPLTFIGESPAVKGAKGMLLEALTRVTVEALPGQLPRTIEVDVSGLAEVDQALHVKDLPLPKGCTIKDDPEQMVVRVQPLRAEVEEVPAKAEAPEAEAEAEAEAEEKPKEETT